MPGKSTFKKKLSIIPCDVEENGNITDEREGDAFELMLNPSSYKYDRSITYEPDCTVGKIDSDSRFKSIDPRTVAFNFVIDATGVVSLPTPGSVPKTSGQFDSQLKNMEKKWKEMSVTNQLKKFSKVVYDYNGKNHEPNVVKLHWGKLLFYGRLTSMNTEFTLFKPDGDPLRAKVDVSFRSYMSAKEEALRKNNSSPDMSHRIVFREGDTLPLLCYRIYKDSTYYSEVAGYNDLVDFRNIKPGTEIAFPPLR